MVVATASLGLDRLPGIRRPGIAATIQGETSPFTVIDVGANPQPKPRHLLHYAVMASIYVRAVRDIQDPRVGLLSIGEEKEKGTHLIKETLALFQENELSCGAVPVEGQAIFSGDLEVVVCDGFVGNVVLKTAEGLAGTLITMCMDLLQEHMPAPDALPAIQATIRKMAKRTDYAETGGAPLLGVAGNCIIAHGRSDERAIANGIRVADTMARENINQMILEELAEAEVPPPEM